MRIILLFVLNAAINLGLGLVVAAVLGPGDYGRFAIGMTVAMVVSTGLFDWLRLSTTRYYGEQCRIAEPDLRATLDTAYLAFGVLLGAALIAALLLGLDFGLGAGLLAASLLFCLANAFFEFQAALARARFRDRAYAALIVTKNLATPALAITAAALLGGPAAVLAAMALGATLAAAVVSLDLRDVAAPVRLANPKRLASFAAYGLPVVAANVVFQIVALANRSAAAALFGYAESGRLALATDLGLRLFLVVGAAVDVFVFQLAVRRNAEHGPQAAAAQLRRNVVIVLAILMLLGVGYALAMPAFEALVVPERYRGPFGTLSLILLPGLMLFCMGQFAISPVLQMAGRTGPVMAAALVTLASDLLGLAVLPRDAGVNGVAIVHSASLAFGTAAVFALALRKTDVLRWDGDILRVLLASGWTAAALWPLRAVQPAWIALGAAALVGPLVYGGTLVLLDVAGLRDLVLSLARRRTSAQRV